MEVLREYGQIVTKTKNVLDYDISETPMLDEMPEEQLEYIANHSNICNEKKYVGELSELVFQLNNFIPALVNYTKIFLYLKKYDYVKEFLSKLYVGHVGNANYVSKLKQYNMQERLFDRFIEVVKIGNISNDLYLPLILESIFNEKSEVYVWHDIGMEYMQTFMREHEDELVETDTYELEYLTLILSFNTQKGISIIFNNRNWQKISEEKADYFLKTYITDTLAFFDKNLPKEKEKRFHYIKILSAINNNVEVDSRLENLFYEEDDDEIKEFLAKRLNISKSLAIGGVKNYQLMAQKKVQEVQERSLDVAFDSNPLMFTNNELANNVEKTYLINIFKQEKNLLNLYGLSSLYDIFDKKSLSNFVERLFNKLSKKEDVLCAKWCVRMICLFCDDLFERTVYEFLNALYRLKRNKEARYFTLCLIYSKKTKFIEMFKRLKNVDAFNENFDEYVNLYGEVMGVNSEEIKDRCLLDEMTNEQIEQEKQRLFQNFISGRRYSKQIFDALFLANKVYNNFAQGLVFGEYKQNKLYSIFLVQGKEIKYIYGTGLDSQDKEFYISIVHQVDIDERFEKLDLNLPNKLFNQFRNSVIDINTFTKQNSTVTNFNGTIVNTQKFIQNMKKRGFYPNTNDNEIPSLVFANKILNLLVEVEFQKPTTMFSQVATLGNVKFYKLSECMMDKNKYITNKSQSISLVGISPRFFDYCIYSIIKEK